MKLIGKLLCLTVLTSGSVARAQEAYNLPGAEAEDWGGWLGDAGGAISDGFKGVGRAASDLGKGISDAVAGLDPVEAVKHASESAAATYHSENNNGNFEDCSLFVIGVLAAAGSYGGPWSAAAGGAAGAAGSRLACRAWYP